MFISCWGCRVLFCQALLSHLNLYSATGSRRELRRENEARVVHPSFTVIKFSLAKVLSSPTLYLQPCQDCYAYQDQKFWGACCLFSFFRTFLKFTFILFNFFYSFQKHCLMLTKGTIWWVSSSILTCSIYTFEYFILHRIIALLLPVSVPLLPANVDTGWGRNQEGWPVCNADGWSPAKILCTLQTTGLRVRPRP